MNNITESVPLMLRRARENKARWRWAGPVSALFICAVICWLAWTVVG